LRKIPTITTSINVGDYLFIDGTIGSTLGDVQPVAVCVAEGNNFVDGKARFISLKMMLNYTDGAQSGTANAVKYYSS
jgi:hypothetical protein